MVKELAAAQTDCPRARHGTQDGKEHLQRNGNRTDVL